MDLTRMNGAWRIKGKSRCTLALLLDGLIEWWHRTFSTSSCLSSLTSCATTSTMNASPSLRRPSSLSDPASVFSNSPTFAWADSATSNIVSLLLPPKVHLAPSSTLSSHMWSFYSSCWARLTMFMLTSMAVLIVLTWILLKRSLRKPNIIHIFIRIVCKHVQLLPPFVQVFWRFGDASGEWRKELEMMPKGLRLFGWRWQYHN